LIANGYKQNNCLCRYKYSLPLYYYYHHNIIIIGGNLKNKQNMTLCLIILYTYLLIHCFRRSIHFRDYLLKCKFSLSMTHDKSMFVYFRKRYPFMSGLLLKLALLYYSRKKLDHIKPNKSKVKYWYYAQTLPAFDEKSTWNDMKLIYRT